MANGSVSVKLICGEDKEKLLEQRKTMEDLEHEIEILGSEDKEGKEENEDTIEGIEIGSEEKQVIVLGSAGSGKTWLLKKLAHQFAEKYINNISSSKLFPLSIFIQLSEMVKFKKEDVIDFIEGK